MTLILSLRPPVGPVRFVQRERYTPHTGRDSERADEPYAITGAITNPWSGAFARGTIQSQCGFDAVLEHLARQNGNILPVCPYPAHLTRGNA